MSSYLFMCAQKRKQEKKSVKEEDDKMTETEFKNYRGTYTGYEFQQIGRKPDGTAWTKYKIMFKHDQNLQYPVKFTLWEPNKHNIFANQLVPGKNYMVTFVYEDFTLKDGTPAKAKKAIKVQEHTSNAPLGFEEQQAPPQQQQDPAPQAQQPQQPMPMPQQQPTLTAEDFADAYMQKFPENERELNHYRILYLHNAYPMLKEVIPALKAIFDQKVKPQQQAQEKVEIEDV